MSDTFDVTGTVTPENPSTGDTVTVTITGVDHHSESSQGTVGPLTLNVSAGGTDTNITVDAVPYTLVTNTDEPVTLVSVTDPSGRVWTVSGDGSSATATA